jgi:hypothetical protein
MISDVEVRGAGSKGKGVFALRSFAQGEFIFRRRHGRTVSSDQIPLLSEEDRMHLCELDWDRCAVLLSPGCYLNHPCDPNAMRTGVKVSAWKPIRAGEEIVIDYLLNATGGDPWDCGCGSSNCLGYVHGGFFSMEQQRQRDYLPHAPHFIRGEYRRRAQGLTPRQR